MRTAFDAVAPRLGTYAPELRDAIATQLREPVDPAALAAKIDAFFADVPARYSMYGIGGTRPFRRV